MSLNSTGLDARSADDCDEDDSPTKTTEDLFSWPELLDMEQFNGSDALIWLEFSGLSVPFQWNRVESMLSSLNATFEEAEHLLKITNYSSLNDVWKCIHEQIRVSLDFYRKGCRGRSYIHFQAIMLRQSGYDMESTWNLSTFGREQLDVLGVTRNRFGRYRRSLGAISANRLRGSRQSYRMRAVNYWFLEQYKKAITYCETFNPFLEDSSHPDGAWNSNLLFGLQIYSLINVRRFKKARRLLQCGIRRDRFKNNSIVTFCAQELRIKSLQKMEYADGAEGSHHFDIFCLFQGMICQYHLKDYLSAIFLYHQCNFYAAHPIHFYRLFECYRMIGLYGKALGCLRIAKFRAHGSVPSSNVCGLSNWDRILSACSDCLSVYYCSKKCQKIGWKVNGHRQQCSKRFKGLSQRLKRAKSSPFVVTC